MLTYDYHLNQNAIISLFYILRIWTQLLLKLYIKHQKLIKRSIETIVDKVSIANVCSSFFAKRSKLSESSFGFAYCIYWTSRRVESSGRGRCWWAARAGIHDAHYVLQCSVELGRRPCRCSSSWAGWRSVMILDWHLVICFLKEFIWEYV